MGEIIAIIALILGFLGLLRYFYFHEKEEREYIKSIQTDLTNLPVNLQKFYADISAKDSQQTQKTLGDSFTKFLKHIEKLEQMVLPKPVTTKDVQSVMSRMGTIADESLEIENDIEKEPNKGVEMPDNGWMRHINADTKVEVEGEDIPTFVEKYEDIY